MKNILINLWDGNISPIENCGKNNPEIENLIRLIEINDEDLINILNEEQRTVYKKYVACKDEYLYLITEQAFCDGFSLATKILKEAL